MSWALGWWRHAALAGLASGLLASTAIAAPAGWLPCVLVGAAALAFVGRHRAGEVAAPDRSRPPPRPILTTPEVDGIGLTAPKGPTKLARPGPLLAAALLASLTGLALLAGLGIGNARLLAIDAAALQGPVGENVTVSGFVAGVARRSFGEVRVPIETADGRVLVIAHEPVEDLPVGGAVHAEGRLSRPDDPYRAGEVQRAGALLQLDADHLDLVPGGRGGLQGALDRVRSRAEGALEAGMDPDEAALARGFVLGQDDRIDPEVRSDFTRAGLSHLLAVSGQNVMLLAILGGVVFAIFGAGLRMRLVLTMLLIAAYVPVAGAGASIERAGVMGVAGILATIAGRPTDRAYPALLAAAVTLTINPRFGADVGWQLSFAALVGIMLWARPLRGLLVGFGAHRLPDRLVAPLAEGAALTIAATVATAPLIAHDFDQLSIAALPANLAVLPLVAPVMWIGMAVGLLAQLPRVQIGPFDPIALLDGLEGRLVDAIAAIARVFGRPDWAQVELPLPGTTAVVAVSVLAAAALTLAIVLARRRRALAAPAFVSLGVGLVVLIALLPFAGGSGGGAGPPKVPGTVRITELDVGQGDAILVEPPRGAPILVDVGPPGGAAAAALRDLGIERLSAIFITHDELDHSGGLSEVLAGVRAPIVIRARREPQLEAVARAGGARVLNTAEGGSFDFGRLELDVLWPPRDHLDRPVENRNFDAIVLAARFDGYDALLSSDAEQEVTHLDPGPLDVLKVAHHGSDDAGLDALLDRSLPQVALISVGADNTYGHPTEQTMDSLASHGVCVLRTDLDGASSVALGRAGLEAWSEDGAPSADRPGCTAQQR